MQAKRELWQYRDKAKVWVGKYKNSHNMPHWHYDCELIYLEYGELDIFCNGSTYRISAGQSFFIDSEQVHYMHARTPDTVARLVIFNYDLISTFTSSLSLVSPVLSADYRLDELYSSLLKKLKEKQPFYIHETALDVAVKFLQIFRNEPTETKKETKADRFKALLTKIDEQYEFFDIQSAAEFLNMNATYFSRLFHSQMGITFSQYLNYVRTKNAVTLLKENDRLSMTEIAIKCGFSTIRNFNRIFKEYTGYTPREMPRDYIMKENVNDISSASQNPTLKECELLESSDDQP